MSYTPKKVFIGLSNIASQINDFTEGFNQLGIPTYTAVRDNETPIKYNKVDVKIPFDKKVKFWFPGVRPKKLQRYLQDKFTVYPKNVLKEVWERAIKECDTFIFMYGTFTPNSSDLAELRRLGKKIVIFCVGSDIYWPNAGDQDFKLHGLEPTKYSKEYLESVNINEKLEYLRNAEKYADLIISGPALSQLFLRPYFRGRHTIPINSIVENVKQSEDNPLIVYAPSNDDYKGTVYVEDAINKLKAEGIKFRVALVKNLEYKKALKLYSEADILIGEMFYPGGGKQQREGLAAGTVVLTNNDPNYFTGLPEGTPFVHVNHQTIYSELKSIILDYPRRKEIAKLGRPFVEKYNQNKFVCQEILEWLSGTRNDQLIQPKFLREKYIPKNEEECITINKWTEFVKDCDWYKKNVPTGVREGLVF